MKILKENIWKNIDIFETPLFHYLALSKIVIQKYISLKYGATADANKFIYTAFYKNDTKKINDFVAIFYFIKYKTNEFITKQPHKEIEEAITDFFTSDKQYERVREYFGELDFSLEEVDAFLKR